MDEMLKHWDLIVSVGMIIASHAKMQANLKESERRVTKLETKQDSTDEKLSDLKADMREVKGMTKMILDQMKEK